MKNFTIILLLAALALGACNKKTAQQKTEPQNAAKKEAAPEKRVTSLEELKGQKVEAKELPADKLENLQKAKNPGAEGGSYKSYYETGYEKHNSGDFQGAINDFTKSIEMNPQYPDAYNFRGMSRYKSGDKSGACADWEKASSLGDASAAEMVQKNCK